MKINFYFYLVFGHGIISLYLSASFMFFVFIIWFSDLVESQMYALQGAPKCSRWASYNECCERCGLRSAKGGNDSISELSLENLKILRKL